MLDGKYEITSERDLSPHETLFGAVAPDGTALHICWYDLNGAEDERGFERYRTLLRQLRREGYAAVYDLVARPGAHYVAWRVPGEVGAAPVTGKDGLEVIETLLAAHGRTLSEACICARPNTPPQVYALAFESAQLSGSRALSEADVPTVGSAETVQNLWTTVWTTLRPWALGGLLTLTGVLLLLFSAQRSLQNGLVNVPDVRGQEVNLALQRLYEAGFRGSPVALTSARPAGEVLEVNPPVGTSLRPGRTVSVRYALPAGRAPEPVPALTGTALRSAEAELLKAGFRVGDVARSYSAARVGTVIAQTPTADSLTAQGGRVGLLVSDGPRGALTFLPELTGVALEEALSLAEASGFAREAVRLERAPGNGVAAGTVLAQNIAPFISVPIRAQLRLTVAESREVLAEGSGTPDLVGLNLGEAQRRAREAGLSVTVTRSVSTTELPDGVVLQRPVPGAPVESGVAVTVNEPNAPPVALRSPVQASVTTETTGAVRRARYVWQLEEGAEGQLASITVELEDGTRETIMQGRRVGADERLEGTYLTTASGPLTFRLTLGGTPYGAPLTTRP